MHASLEDTSWEKRLRKQVAFETTHEIAYLNYGEFLFAAGKKLHCRFLFFGTEFRICRG